MTKMAARDNRNDRGEGAHTRLLWDLRDQRIRIKENIAAGRGTTGTPAGKEKERRKRRSNTREDGTEDGAQPSRVRTKTGISRGGKIAENREGIHGLCRQTSRPGEGTPRKKRSPTDTEDKTNRGDRLGARKSHVASAKGDLLTIQDKNRI